MNFAPYTFVFRVWVFASGGWSPSSTVPVNSKNWPYPYLPHKPQTLCGITAVNHQNVRPGCEVLHINPHATRASGEHAKLAVHQLSAQIINLAARAVSMRVVGLNQGEYAVGRIRKNAQLSGQGMLVL